MRGPFRCADRMYWAHSIFFYGEATEIFCTLAGGASRLKLGGGREGPCGVAGPGFSTCGVKKSSIFNPRLGARLHWPAGSARESIAASGQTPA